MKHTLLKTIAGFAVIVVLMWVVLNSDSFFPTNDSNLSPYVNSKYDFGFEHPKDWKLEVDRNQDMVKVSSINPQEVFSVTFRIIDKKDFESVGTKVGNISFDPAKNALVDTSSDGGRCLRVTPLMNVSGATESFMYGGSTMSTPAHFEYAVLTQTVYMILVEEESDPPIDEALRQEWNDKRNEFYRSFTLTNDNYSFIPPCAQEGSM